LKALQPFGLSYLQNDFSVSWRCNLKDQLSRVQETLIAVQFMYTVEKQATSVRFLSC